MSAFTTVKIPAQCRAQLAEIRDNLARGMGGNVSVSIAQATVAAIDTLHRIQNDPDLADHKSQDSG